MKKHICRGRCAFYDCKSVLLVTDVLFLGGIEEEVADGSNEGVNTKSEVCKKEVCPRSRGKAFGLELGVVDDDASDKAEEEGQDKANYVFGVHGKSPWCKLKYLNQTNAVFDCFRVYYITKYVGSQVRMRNLP